MEFYIKYRLCYTSLSQSSGDTSERVKLAKCYYSEICYFGHLGANVSGHYEHVAAVDLCRKGAMGVTII